MHLATLCNNCLFFCLRISETLWTFQAPDSSKASINHLVALLASLNYVKNVARTLDCLFTSRVASTHHYSVDHIFSINLTNAPKPKQLFKENPIGPQSKPPFSLRTRMPRWARWLLSLELLPPKLQLCAATLAAPKPVAPQVPVAPPDAPRNSSREDVAQVELIAFFSNWGTLLSVPPLDLGRD